MRAASVLLISLVAGTALGQTFAGLQKHAYNRAEPDGSSGSILNPIKSGPSAVVADSEGSSTTFIASDSDKKTIVLSAAGIAVAGISVTSLIAWRRRRWMQIY